MSNNLSGQLTDHPRSAGGPVDRPNGSIDDDSVHPLTDPDDPSSGNIDPMVPLGNAPSDTETDKSKDTRLTRQAGPWSQTGP
jgi:hypothetical protein